MAPPSPSTPDPITERRVARFVASRDSVLMVCVVTSLLGVLNGITNGRKGIPGTIVRLSHHLFVALLRLGVERIEPQAKAHQIFAWGVCAITGLLAMGLVVLQVAFEQPLITVPANAMLITCALIVLTTLYLRHMAVYTEPRLCTICIISVSAFFSSACGRPFSELPSEPVAVAASVLLGELVGHTMEVGWTSERAEVSSATTTAATTAATTATTTAATTSEVLNEASFDSATNLGKRQLLQRQLDEHLAKLAARPHQQQQQQQQRIGGDADGGFDVLGLIGRGGSSDVFLVSRRGELFAMKRVSKARLKPKQRQMVAEEMAILKQIRHPFVVSLHTTLESERFVYMALNYAGGGDLSAWLDHLTPSRSRIIIAEVLLGLRHIHAAKVIYRDLKLENTLVALDGHIMLADFGASKRLLAEGRRGAEEGSAADEVSAAAQQQVVPPSSTSTLIGTPSYMSPQQWRGEAYSYEIDWWAMAVMLHEMLTGDAVGVCRDNAPSLLLEQIDDADARDLLPRMLTWDLHSRLGYDDPAGDQVKAHPYFEGKADFEALLKKAVTGPLLIEDHSLPKHMGQSLPAGGDEHADAADAADTACACGASDGDSGGPRRRPCKSTGSSCVSAEQQ